MLFLFIHHVGQPGRQLKVEQPVPWVEGDVVTVVGGSRDGDVLNVSKDSDGNFLINLNEEQINGDRYVWTFKVTYATQ